MNNLIIEYDLNKPGQDYPRVHEAIKALNPGGWARIHPSCWYVKSGLTAAQARDRVWSVMDGNDSLIVVDATNNNCAWQNLNPKVETHLRTYWMQASASTGLQR